MNHAINKKKPKENKMKETTQTEQATYKRGDLEAKVPYVITNPLTDWSDFEEAFGGKQPAIEKCSRYCDYHGTKGQARSQIHESVESAIESGDLDDTEEAILTYLGNLEITVAHQLGGTGAPTVTDRKKAELLVANMDTTTHESLNELAEKIGVEQLEAWDVDAVANLRAKKRAFTRAVKRQDPLADF